MMGRCTRMRMDSHGAGASRRQAQHTIRRREASACGARFGNGASASSDRAEPIRIGWTEDWTRARLKNMFSASDWLVEGRGVRRSPPRSPPVATATTRSECLGCRRIAANTLQEHLIATLTAPRLHECSISHRMTSLPSAPASNPFLRQCLVVDLRSTSRRHVLKACPASPPSCIPPLTTNHLLCPPKTRSSR